MGVRAIIITVVLGGYMRGRPGGNPDIVKYSFTTDRPESCTAPITFKFTPSDLEQLKMIPNYRELVREKVKEIIKEHSAKP